MSDSNQSLAVCHLCDWVVRMPALDNGESAFCPRCDTRLHTRRDHGPETTMAWGVATLLALIIALSFRFLWFESQGIENSIVLFDAALALVSDDYALLALLVALTTVVLPAIYLFGMLYLSACMALERALPGARAVAHLLRPIQPWLMGDVFIVGVLVSLTKIVSLAEIAIGPSFIAFCAYALLMLRSMHVFHPHAFWERFAGPAAVPRHLCPGHPAAGQGVVDCASCGAPFIWRDGHRCPRCGRPHAGLGFRRFQWTWALLVSAAILLIPANALPIMATVSLGYDSPATIIGGVRHLIEVGSWPIAMVIFLASIVVPIGKILMLGWLCIVVRAGRAGGAKQRLRLYRFTEFIGRWSMIDVFVVAVLTALIQAGRLMAVHPGPAAVAFAGAVILTMLAAVTFNPRAIWQQPDATTEQGA